MTNLRRLAAKVPSLLPKLVTSLKANSSEWQDLIKATANESEKRLPKSILSQFGSGSIISLALVKALFPNRFVSGSTVKPSFNYLTSS